MNLRKIPGAGATLRETQELLRAELARKLRARPQQFITMTRETAPGRLTDPSPAFMTKGPVGSPSGQKRAAILDAFDLQMNRALHDRAGDRITRAGGLRQAGPASRGPGYYEGNISPGQQIAVARRPRSPLQQELDRAEGVDSVFGALMGQDAIAGGSFAPRRGGSSVMADLGREPTVADIEAVRTVLGRNPRRGAPGALGPDDPYYISGPSGLKIMDPNDTSAAQSGLAAAVAEALPGARARTGEAPGYYLGNDWSSPEGRFGRDYGLKALGAGAENWFDQNGVPLIARDIRGAARQFQEGTGLGLGVDHQKLLDVIAERGLRGWRDLAQFYKGGRVKKEC